MLAPMPARRLSAAAALAVGAIFVVVPAGCGPNTDTSWLCLNPITGKEDGTVMDPTHYVNGVYDPCHCYDPSGPSKACPIVVPTMDVDAGSD